MKIPERRRSWDDFDFMRRMAQLDVDDDEDVRRGDGDDTHDDLMQHLFSSSRLSNARENNDNNNEIDHQEENTNPLTATFQRLRGVVRRMRTSDAGDEAAEQREEERAVDEGEANAEDGDDDHDGIDQSITVLNLAARHGGIEILNILLDLGAIAQDDALHDTVNYIESLTNPIRYSGLSMPDIAAGMACLEALLDAGADVNAEHPVTKMTPLHVAAEGTCHEVLSLLLQRGADPGKRTASGETAAEIAEYHDDSHAVDILNRFSRLQRLSTFNRSASQRERESQENNTEELAEELVCVACLTERKGVILAPCGHKVLCRRCTRRLFTRPEQERKCPLCRQKLESFVVQIFDT
jgi:ankyrin repeat protein